MRLVTTTLLNFLEYLRKGTGTKFLKLKNAMGRTDSLTCISEITIKLSEKNEYECNFYF